MREMQRRDGDFGEIWEEGLLMSPNFALLWWLEMSIMLFAKALELNHKQMLRLPKEYDLQY